MQDMWYRKPLYNTVPRAIHATGGAREIALNGGLQSGEEMGGAEGAASPKAGVSCSKKTLGIGGRGYFGLIVFR